MEISTTTARRVSVFTWGMAVFATVAGQLHALSRINSHPGDLDEGFAGVWARARDGCRAPPARLG